MALVCFVKKDEWCADLAGSAVITRLPQVSNWHKPTHDTQQLRVSRPYCLATCIIFFGGGWAPIFPTAVCHLVVVVGLMHWWPDDF